MADGSGDGVPLVGRSDVLALLTEEVGERAGCVALIGPVGVGKSHVLTAWVAELEAAGGTAVVARATRSTATIPFGAFAGWVPERLVMTGDRLSVLTATAARLAGEGGRALAVDDAHLLDDGSAALVLHLVQHTRLAVVLTVRQGEPCPDAIVALWKERLARRVDLRPLSEHQSADLLQRLLGGVVAPPTRRRLWALTEGNPLYLREVIEAARAQGVLVHADGMWRWQGGLAGGTRLVELVSDRMGAGDTAARRALELVALGEPLPAEVLARLAPRSLLADLESRGLVVVERPSPRDAATDQAVRLAHPLYTEVLRAELPAFTARDHAAALVEAAIATGVDRRDPVRVASWLLETGDDPTEPDLLLRASSRARVIDHYELSARFAEAAERAGGGWRATVARAVALGPLGQLDEVDALLESLTAPGREPEARVAAVRVRAEQTFWHRGEDLAVARAILAEAAGESETPGRLPRSALLGYSAELAVGGLDLDDAVRLATQAYNEADNLIDRLRALSSAGLAAVFLGRTGAALTAFRWLRPGAMEVLEDDPMPAFYAAQIYSLAAIPAGRIDQVAAFYETLAEQRYGGDRGVSQALLAYWAGRAALEQGRVATAVRWSRESLRLLGDQNQYGRGTRVANTLALAAAQSGDHETAAAAIAWIEGRALAYAEADACQIELARAWLHAARGELSAAREMALATAGRGAKAGAWLVEMTALAEAARLGAPAAVAARLEELTRVVEGPFVVAAARFARAAADGDGSGLDDAAARFTAMGARLRAAEAASAASAAHASAGLRRRRAASRLTADRLAAQCEGAATPMLAQLDHEPPVASLTEREREVAELAARGRTSREIATALGVTMRTVYSHLNHAYAKLGISDRATLASLLGLDPEPAREAGPAGQPPEP